MYVLIKKKTQLIIFKGAVFCQVSVPGCQIQKLGLVFGLRLQDSV